MEKSENSGVAMEDQEHEAKANGTISGSGHAPDDINEQQNSKMPSSESSETQSAAASLQAWADKTLYFLSHASNEMLGACLVGLGASTYLVLGRVGLVLIGVVGGIALHATWDGMSGGGSDIAVARESEARKRKELGVQVVDRVWRWRNDRAQDETASDDMQDLKLNTVKSLDFSAYDPQTSAALETFVSAIIRDYVKYATSFTIISIH